MDLKTELRANNEKINVSKINDLRSFLKLLESQTPEDFFKVKKEVNPKFEVTALLKKLENISKFPVVLFENVKGYKMPILANVHATRERLAKAIGVSENMLLNEYIKCEENPVEPTIVKSGPIKETILIKDDVDLTKLPIVTHNKRDSGPYISAGIVVTKNLDTGKRNEGMYRMMLKGKKKLGFWVGEGQHGWYNLQKAWEFKKPLEVAVIIGHHPAVYLGSQSRIPYGKDEYNLMGSLIGSPLEIVKCETVDLEVPAYAEIVIEGEIPPYIFEPEAPFGEYHWYYGEERNSPIINVKAITHRRDAIYQTIFTAHQEHTVMSLPQSEASIYKHVKSVVPTLNNVIMPTWGGKYTVILSIKKMVEGQGKFAGIAASASEAKNIIVVDDDIDIKNDQDVFWAIATRTHADKDFISIPDVKSSSLPPTSYNLRTRAERGSLDVKLIIDATKPIDFQFPERAEPPEEVVKNIILDEYLQKKVNIKKIQKSSDINKKI